MKRCIPSLLLVLAAVLPTISSAQIWIENRTDTNFTFAFRGHDSLGVLTAEDQYAGARLSFNFDSLAKTLRIDVTNLSGGWHIVGVGDEMEIKLFGAGTLTGFGFETAPDELTATAFDAGGNSAFNAFGYFGTDWVNFVLNQPFDLSGGGGGGDGPFDMDVGASRTGNVSAGLAAGHGASFLFTFNTPDFEANLFNPLDFFFLDDDADTWDMSFRFQQTSGIYKDHRCTHYCDCGGEGSDKVALAFHLEEDFQVPEPSTYGLLGAGALLALALGRRFRRR